MFEREDSETIVYFVSYFVAGLIIVLCILLFCLFI